MARLNINVWLHNTASRRSTSITSSSGWWGRLRTFFLSSPSISHSLPGDHQGFGSSRFCSRAAEFANQYMVVVKKPEGITVTRTSLPDKLSTKMACTLDIGACLTFSSLRDVAVLGYEISLGPNVTTKRAEHGDIGIEQTVWTPPQFCADFLSKYGWGNMKSSAFLKVEVSRAIIMIKLVTLLNQKFPKPSPVVLQLLTDWLNEEREVRLPVACFPSQNAESEKMVSIEERMACPNEELQFLLLARICDRNRAAQGISQADANAFLKSSLPFRIIAELFVAAVEASSVGRFAVCSRSLLIEALRLPYDQKASIHSTATSSEAHNGICWLLNESKTTPRTAEEIIGADGVPGSKEIGAKKGTNTTFDAMRQFCDLIGNLADAADGFTSIIRLELKAMDKASSSPVRIRTPLVGLKSAVLELANNTAQLLGASQHHYRQVAGLKLVPSSSKQDQLDTPVCLKISDQGETFANVESCIRETNDAIDTCIPLSAKASTSDLVVSLSKALDLLQRILVCEVTTGLNMVQLLDIQAFNSAIEKVLANKKKTGPSRHPIGPELERFKKLLVEQVSKDPATNECLLANVQTSVSFPYISANIDKWENLTCPRNQGTRKPKIAKGAQDITPRRIAIRDQLIKVIIESFRRHGAVQIDTPIFELKETLTGKYGEDSKLIYDLKNQGGEQLSLRYDLTVPLARFVATQKIDKLKRYHIGKVYRRDEPQMAKGRYREFYQCDFDVIGHGDTPEVCDAEVIRVVVEILRALRPLTGNFKLRINNRRLLDVILMHCGVSEDEFKTVCSSIDKLDKLSWTAVENELVDVKGLSNSTTTNIKGFVAIKGNFRTVVQNLRSIGGICDTVEGKDVLNYMEEMFDCLEEFGVRDEVEFDLSLARGLDYYTGIIYEGMLTDETVGSVVGGGRYDKLVGMFAGRDIPAVGVSMGIERLFRIAEKRLGLLEEDGSTLEVASLIEKADCPVRESVTDVFVTSVGKNLVKQRMKLCSVLWDGGVACETFFADTPKLKKQLDYASEKRIPFVVTFGEDELQKGTVQFRELLHDGARDTNKPAPFSMEVPRSELLVRIKERLSVTGTSAENQYKAVLSPREEH